MTSRLGDLASPLKYRDFRFLWLAQITSEVGDWAGRLALAVFVAEKTGSAVLTALVTAVSVVPYVGIGQLLTAYANRFPRRQVIVVTDLGRAIVFASLTIPMPTWCILVLAFIAGCLTPPFEAARGSLTVLTVPSATYGDAVALASITFDMAVLFGYAAGGAMLAILGPRPALLMNAGSFLLSALLLIQIESARHAPEGGADVRVRDGWRAIVDDPFVRRLLVGYTWVGACAVVGESLVALYALQVLVSGGGLSGLLAASIPAGAVIATILGRSHADDTGKLRRASQVALAGSAVGLAIFIAAPEVPLILVGFAAIGALNASRVPATEVAVLRLEDRMRGPSISVINGVLLGSQAVAATLGGFVAHEIGVRETIVISLLISGVVGLWGTLRPPHELRHGMRSPTTPR